jgi:hypothetical protein
MFDRLALHASALGLAALLTFAMLAGVDALAGRHDAAIDATELAAAQHVVITGHRLPRS